MKTIIYFIPLLILAGCNGNEPTNEVTPGADTTGIVQFTNEQFVNAGLTIGVAEEREMSQAIRVNGKIDVPPQNRVSISFPMGGYLQSTSLLPGMKITKGQTLAVMQDQSYVELQESYLVAVSRYELVRKEYERQSELHISHSVSDKVFEQAKCDYESQQISLGAIRQKLLLIGIQPEALKADNISRSVSVKSPVDGFVSKVNVNVGQYLNPEDVMFELVDPAELHLSLTVFEKDLPFISAGQKVRVSLPAKPGQTFEAEVTYVNQELDLNRAAEVHCEFIGEIGGALTGAFVTAEIQLNKAKVLSVPDGAVVRLRDSEYIFVETGSLQYRRVQVVTGASQDGWTEISYASESLAGKKIITANAWSALMLQENVSE